MENEEFQKLILAKLGELGGKIGVIDDLKGTQDLLVDQFAKMFKKQVELSKEIQEVKDIQLRMESDLTERAKGFNLLQRDTNRDVAESLNRIEAKVDVLQLETAHIRRVK